MVLGKSARERAISILAIAMLGNSIVSLFLVADNKQQPLIKRKAR